MNDEMKGRIDGLNDTLNSRTRYRDPLDKRTPVKPLEDAPEVGERWNSPDLDAMLKHERIVEPINPFIKRIFVLALVFFVGAVGIAGYIFVGGGTFVSSKNVDITVLGPTSVSAGSMLELGVSISNTNNADLEVANLSIQYPEGARNPDNSAEPITYTKDDLGAIKAGAEVVRNVRVVLLGTMGETKEIKFSIEYKVKGSNATFYKDKIYEVTIGEAPITLDIQSPSSVNSGGDFTTSVAVTLNATDVLRNVVLKAEYPYGYTMTDATPRSATSENIWVLGDLLPGDKKTISIKGRLVGENEEERTFRFYVGVADSLAAPNLKIPITSLLNTIAIDRPSVGVNINFNGDTSSPYIAPAERPISANIKFQNNLSDKLLNPHIEVTLSGTALDKNSVKPGYNGLYDPSSSRVVWDPRNASGQSELAPGASGQVTVVFNSLPATSITQANQDMVLKLVLTGSPVGSVGQQPVTITETRTIRISSQINLSAKALRSIGPFANKGPVPPKVGEETTYGIVFEIGNTQGDISEGKITARLGPEVTYLGAPSSGGENIVYDSASRTLTWTIGNLPSGTGFSSSPRQLAFQVSLKPILGQIGTAPMLVNNIVLTGKDSATGDSINTTAPTITTKLTSDPAFIQGDDIVVK